MTQTMWHVPLALIGATIPLLGYHLVRTIAASHRAALFAAAALAVAPLLVSQDRYTYSAETLGLFGASAAMLAARAHIRHPSARAAWRTGLIIAATLLSHLLFHAWPVALLYLSWILARRQGLTPRQLFARFCHAGIVIPPLAAVIVMVIAYEWRNAGPLGHLLFKQHVETTAVAGLTDVAEHLIWLARQFGYVGTLAAAVGLVAGVRSITRGQPAGVFLVWAVAFLAPLILGQRYYGRMYGYYGQACFALICLAGIACDAALKSPRWRRPASVAFIVVMIQFSMGTFSTVFAADAYSHWTGVTSPIGAATPDPGYRAAGWYVRTHVPPAAAVFTPHGMDGLEYMNAAFYMGRFCLAGENFTPAQMQRIYAGFHNRIDVIVAEPRFDSFAADPAWHVVARVMDGRQTLIRIYARAGNDLPKMVLPLAEFNRQYDARFAPRQIPEMLPAPRGLPAPHEITAAAQGGRP